MCWSRLRRDVGWLRDRLYVDELYGSDGDCILCVVGARCGLAGPPGLGRSGGRGCWVFALWAQLNRFLDTNWVDGGFDKGCDELARRAAACSRACRRARAELPENSGAGRGGAGRDFDLEQPAHERISNIDAVDRAALGWARRLRFSRASTRARWR